MQEKHLVCSKYPGIQTYRARSERVNFMQFETILTQYEPMMNATLRQLHIYRDHELYRQAGRIALWQAWQRYDPERGDFTPFAARSIRGAMLDELKKQHRYETFVTQTEDDVLQQLVGHTDSTTTDDYDDLIAAIAKLTKEEQQLIQWLYIDKRSHAQCATAAGITIAGIKKRRERLLVKLKKVLQQTEHF